MKPTYRDKVYKFLIQMQPGRVYPIDQLCKPDTREQFFQVLKDFIAFGDGSVMGFGLEFTSDYSGIVKVLNISDK